MKVLALFTTNAACPSVSSVDSIHKDTDSMLVRINKLKGDPCILKFDSRYFEVFEKSPENIPENIVGHYQDLVLSANGVIRGSGKKDYDTYNVLDKGTIVMPVEGYLKVRLLVTGKTKGKSFRVSTVLNGGLKVSRFQKEINRNEITDDFILDAPMEHLSRSQGLPFSAGDYINICVDADYDIENPKIDLLFEVVPLKKWLGGIK
jgi:hypothetical protein